MATTDPTVPVLPGNSAVDQSAAAAVDVNKDDTSTPPDSSADSTENTDSSNNTDTTDTSTPSESDTGAAPSTSDNAAATTDSQDSSDDSSSSDETDSNAESGGAVYYNPNLSVHPSVAQKRVAPGTPSSIQDGHVSFDDNHYVDPVMLQSLVVQESGGNPNAVSDRGAGGLAQMRQATFDRFKDPGDKLLNPKDNLKVATRYLSFLQDRFSKEGLAPGEAPTPVDPRIVMAAYHAGEGTGDHMIAKYGRNYNDIAPHLADVNDGHISTQDYVRQTYTRYLRAQGDEPNLPGSQPTPTQSQPSDQSDPNNTVISSADLIKQSQAVDSSVKGLGQVLQPLFEDPKFNDLTYQQKIEKVNSVLTSKQWSPEAYTQAKGLMDTVWNSADPAQLPSFEGEQQIGKPPITPADQDPTKTTNAWQDSVRTQLAQSGISSATLGTKLDSYLNDASQKEIAAYGVRNRGWTQAILANTLVNVPRSMAEGVASLATEPLAAAVRIPFNDNQFADALLKAPEALESVMGPSDAYLYQTDEKGYRITNPDGTPQTRWMNSTAKMFGNLGGMLASGGMLAGPGVEAEAAVEASPFGFSKGAGFSSELKGAESGISNAEGIGGSPQEPPVETSGKEYARVPHEGGPVGSSTSGEPDTSFGPTGENAPQVDPQTEGDFGSSSFTQDYNNAFNPESSSSTESIGAKNAARRAVDTNGMTDAEARAANIASVSHGIHTKLLAQNTMQIAGSIYQDVYDKTGDRNKALHATLFSFPIAELGAWSEISSMSQFTGAWTKNLSTFNKAVLLAQKFGNAAVPMGLGAAGMDWGTQHAEDAQTGEAYDPWQTAKAGGIGVATGGFVSSLDAIGLIKGIANTTEARNKAADEAQKLQNSLDTSRIVPVDPNSLSPAFRKLMGIDVQPNPQNPEHESIFTKTVDGEVPEETSDEAPVVPAYTDLEGHLQELFNESTPSELMDASQAPQAEKASNEVAKLPANIDEKIDALTKELANPPSKDALTKKQADLQQQLPDLESKEKTEQPTREQLESQAQELINAKNERMAKLPPNPSMGDLLKDDGVNFREHQALKQVQDQLKNYNAHIDAGNARSDILQTGTQLENISRPEYAQEQAQKQNELDTLKQQKADAIAADEACNNGM